MNRFESTLAVLVTLVIFASTMIDPKVTLALFILLALIYLVGSNVSRVNEWFSH